jgi:NADP-dependent 3-hydroxy acid dehydrogenase YdfG
MRVLITGNSTDGLSAAIGRQLEQVTFVSRTTGVDLTTKQGQDTCADMALTHDVFINCSALWRFNQTLLMETVYQNCMKFQHRMHMIAIGSTTDRVKNGKVWMYNAEKKALRDWCNTLALNGVWGQGPKVSYMSFGTLSNNQHKHVDRRCLDIDVAAAHVIWLMNLPKFLNINEISIDPMQDEHWHVG